MSARRHSGTPSKCLTPTPRTPDHARKRKSEEPSPACGTPNKRPRIGLELPSTPSSSPSTPSSSSFCNFPSMPSTPIMLAQPADPEEEAKRLRLDGNQKFRMGDFQAACASYTLALSACACTGDCLEEKAICHCNRAQARAKCKLYSDSLLDAQAALEANPLHHKAYLVGGKALVEQMDFDGAIKFFTEGANKTSSPSSDDSLGQQLQGWVKKAVEMKEMKESMVVAFNRCDFETAEADLHTIEATGGLEGNTNLIDTKLQILERRGKDSHSRTGYSQAVDTFSEALLLAEKYGKVEMAAVMHNLRALSHLMTDTPASLKAALEDCVRSLNVIDKNPSLRDQWQVCQARKAQVLQALALFSEAVASLEDAVVYATTTSQRVDLSMDLKEGWDRTRARMADRRQKAGTCQVNGEAAFRNMSVFAVLGLGKKCTTEDIERSYKKFALLWHPDKNLVVREYANVMLRRYNTARLRAQKVVSRREEFEGNLSFFERLKAKVGEYSSQPVVEQQEFDKTMGDEDSDGEEGDQDAI